MTDEPSKMRKQLGIGTEYIVAALAALALLVALVYGVHRYAEGERKAGYAQAVAEYTIKVNEVVAKYRVLEKAGADAQTKIVVQLNKDKADAIAKKDSTIASLRNGTLRLRDPGNTASCSAGPATTTSASGDNGAGGSELSRSTSEALIAIVSDADQIARKLQAAQKILVQDRKTCNGRD